VVYLFGKLGYIIKVNMFIPYMIDTSHRELIKMNISRHQKCFVNYSTK